MSSLRIAALTGASLTCLSYRVTVQFGWWRDGSIHPRVWYTIHTPDPCAFRFDFITRCEKPQLGGNHYSKFNQTWHQWRIDFNQFAIFVKCIKLERTAYGIKMLKYVLLWHDRDARFLFATLRGCDEERDVSIIFPPHGLSPGILSDRLISALVEPGNWSTPRGVCAH